MTVLGSRAWRNLALLMLLGVLVLIVVWRPSESPQPAHKLTNLAVESIEHIRIARMGKPDIQLQRREGNWWLTAPIEIAANEQQVEGLLNLAAKTSHSTYPAAQVELSEFGLKPSLATVYLDSEALAFGAINPVNRRRYVLINEGVHLVTDDGFDPYTAKPSAYVSNRLLPANVQIARLSLPGLTLSRGQDDAWNRDNVSTEQTEDLVAAWQSASALWVSDASNVADQPLVTLDLSNGDRLQFAIMAKEPELVLARPDLALAYHLPASDADKLLRWTSPNVDES